MQIGKFMILAIRINNLCNINSADGTLTIMDRFLG